MLKTEIIDAPTQLHDYIYCYRVSVHDGNEKLSVRVCPNGMPGLVFSCATDGKSAIDNIQTQTSSRSNKTEMPLVFLHGIITQLSTMHFMPGPFMTIQVLLYPYAPRVLFGIDATALTDKSTPAGTFNAQPLADELVTARSLQERLKLIENYLIQKISTATAIDVLVQESLKHIQDSIMDIDASMLEKHTPLSSRQFSRRFLRVVGITPGLYMRIRRFNEAMRLIDEKSYDRLSDVGAALNYHDQSHFIRDIKLFSGVTPKSISQKVSDFSHDRTVSAYYLGSS